jgi:hypothetical protein
MNNKKVYVYDKDRQNEDQTITRICIQEREREYVGQDYLVTFTLHTERNDLVNEVILY